MPTTPDRDREVEVARRHDRRDDIIVVADADDDGGRRWTVAFLKVVRGRLVESG
jgi:hypothetical protein